MGITFYSTPEEYAERYLNNDKTIKESDKDIINETKQTIISLAYSDCLTPYDLDELSQILSTRYLYCVRKNEDYK